MAALFGFINITLAILVIAGIVSGTFFAWFFLMSMLVLIIFGLLDS